MRERCLVKNVPALELSRWSIIDNHTNMSKPLVSKRFDRSIGYVLFDAGPKIRLVGGSNPQPRACGNHGTLIS